MVERLRKLAVLYRGVGLRHGLELELDAAADYIEELEERLAVSEDYQTRYYG